MKLPRRKFLHLAAGAAALLVVFASLFFGQGASSQAGTIKIIVPIPPGGALDMLTRLIADHMVPIRAYLVSSSCVAADHRVHFVPSHA
jgi:hypothetical protein